MRVVLYQRKNLKMFCPVGFETHSLSPSSQLFHQRPGPIWSHTHRIFAFNNILLNRIPCTIYSVSTKHVIRVSVPTENEKSRVCPFGELFVRPPIAWHNNIFVYLLYFVKVIFYILWLPKLYDVMYILLYSVTLSHVGTQRLDV